MTLSELVIKITCDSKAAVSGIGAAEKSASKLSGMADKVGRGMSSMGKVIGGAVAAGVAGIAALAASAVKAYAEYEQLVGGVETLFKESAPIVQKYAHDAFKTVGVDANTYMKTVTSFSASLLQSVAGDTQKAAEIAHMAMVDMSDNANKMGTDMNAIMAAYQGFAKQNFTMLDNLKLGYGGTRKEMQRLLKDAQKLTGKKYNINNLKDIYEAIHAIQEELGIAGTTAKEAETTIQGSFNSMKAAWENLKIAMADPEGNIDKALQDVIKSAETFGKNIAPVIGNAVRGISTAIKEIAPVIGKDLPKLLGDILPDLVSAASSIVSGIAQAIMDNAGAIIDGFGQIFQQVGETLESSDNPIFRAVGKVISTIGSIIRDPKNAAISAVAWLTEQLTGIDREVTITWINENWDRIVWAWDEAQRMTGEIIKQYWSWILQGWDVVKSSFDIALSWAGDTIEVAVKWIRNAWDNVKSAYDTAVSWAGDVIEVAVRWIRDAWSTVSEAYTTAKSWTKKALKVTVKWIREAWGTISEAFETASGWVEKTFRVTVEWVRIAWDTISSAFSTARAWVNHTFEVGVKWVRTAWDTITEAFKIAKDWVNKSFNVTINFIKGLWQDVKSFIDSIPRRIEVTVDTVRGSGMQEYLGEHVEESPLGGILKPIWDWGTNLLGGIFGHAKGLPTVPYDNYPALLHRGETLLTASQSRQLGSMQSGSGSSIQGLRDEIVAAIKEGMLNAQVNSYLDGKRLTDEISRIMGGEITSRRFA